MTTGISSAKHSSKIALVTGASRGIGASIAERLARDGFHVIINYASSDQLAQALCEKINANESVQSRGGKASPMKFNVGSSSEVDAACDAIHKQFGPIAVLVNNAGINRDGLLLRLSDQDLDRTLDIDLKGAIYCTRAAAKQMLRAKTGSIIQISSVIGEMGNAGQSAYSAAKAGLIGFSKSVAKELASRSIRVNVVAPGYIATEMTEALTDAQKEEILRRIPLGSIGLPEDVASLVSFLASSESRYITGQVVGINGGMYI